MPGPLSLTVSCTQSLRRRTATSMRPPAGTYFSPFSMRLVSQLREQLAIALRDGRGVAPAGEREALRCGDRLEQLDQLGGKFTDIHRRRGCEWCAGFGERDLQQRGERSLQMIDFPQCRLDRLVHRRLERR